MENKERKNEIGIFQMMKYVSVPTFLNNDGDPKELQEKMEMVIRDFSERLGVSIDDLERIIEDLSDNQDWFIFQDRCYNYKGNLEVIRKYFSSVKQNCMKCKFITRKAPDGHDEMYSQEFCKYHRKFFGSYAFTSRKNDCKQFERRRFPSLKSVRDLITSIFHTAITDEIGAKCIKTSYKQMRDGKIATIKQIFVDLGEKFAPYADCLTDEELVKTHDFFNKHSKETDDEAGSEGLWTDYFENVSSGAILSEKTLTKLKDRDAFVYGES